MSFYLREIERNDVRLINEWRKNKELISHLGGTFRFINSEVDEIWFDNYMASRQNNVRLVVCRSSDHKVIGATYLLGIDWLNRSAEFAIWIGDVQSQGQGAGKKSLEETLRHAFEDLNLYRVYLTVLSTNDRARNLYKSAGFVTEGTLRSAVFKNGKYADLVQMAILANEFFELNVSKT